MRIPNSTHRPTKRLKNKAFHSIYMKWKKVYCVFFKTIYAGKCEFCVSPRQMFPKTTKMADDHALYKKFALILIIC